MKLLNPDDAALNAAFAEKVCGWSKVIGAWTCGKLRGSWRWRNRDFRSIPGVKDRTPSFTTSANAVLPWLPKTIEEGWWNISGPSNKGFFCEVCFGEDEADDSKEGRAWAKTVPLAIVVCLLRAHGVEVEFTSALDK